MAIEKVFEGSITAGTLALTGLTALQAKYSSLVIIGHQQYAGDYHTIAHVSLATIASGGTVNALTAGFGWDRAIPAYFFRSEDNGNYYVNWNGGEQNGQTQSFTVTLILGVPKDAE